MYRAGSLRAVAEEISKYKLDKLEYRRSDGMEVALNQQANIHFSMERGMKIMNWVQVFFIHKSIISEVKSVEFVC
jgi:hypothetical protein